MSGIWPPTRFLHPDRTGREGGMVILHPRIWLWHVKTPVYRRIESPSVPCPPSPPSPSSSEQDCCWWEGGVRGRMEGYKGERKVGGGGGKERRWRGPRVLSFSLCSSKSRCVYTGGRSLKIRDNHYGISFQKTQFPSWLSDLNGHFGDREQIWPQSFELELAFVYLERVGG